MLYLASKSLTRHQLLSSMGIPFTVIDHTASEVLEDPSLKGEAFVAAVARQKMEHAVIPAGEPGEQCFVLTADSLCADRNGKLYAKPADRVEAVAQLKALRSGGSVITAFCLDRHEWQGKWVVAQRIEQATVTTYQLDLPDSWIDTYLDCTPSYLQTSGSLTVEGCGAQFMKSMNGSYTGALGLPLAELRDALEQLRYYRQ